MTPVNLKSLAEELNMSIATVSRALRDSHEVSEATKQRVRALAAARHYEPNAYASSSLFDACFACSGRHRNFSFA